MSIKPTRRKLMESGVFMGIGGLFLPLDWREATEGAGRMRFQGRRQSDSRELPVPYPEAPFITTMGGEYALNDEQVASILSLHPDVLSSRNALEFAIETGLPATRQMWLSSFFDEHHRTDTELLRQQSDWTYPDGSPVEDPVGILAEQFDGTPHERWDGKVLPSVFAPATLDLIEAEAMGHFERGFSAVQFGNIRIPRIRGLDFSVWAQAAFRDHLNELPSNRRDELGISDPDSFDIRDYLEAEGLTPGSSTHPADDPTFREFLLFHHRGVKSLLRSVHEWVDETFSQRSPPFYLDQPIGDPYLWECAVAETYASEHVDLVSVEDYRTMPADEFGVGGNPNRVIPDKDVRDFVYKLMWATARHEKPVQVWDVFGGEYYADVSSGDEYPRLLRLQTAEAYAMGCERRLTLTDAPFSWRHRAGRLPEVLGQFIDFLWAHHRFLRNARPENRVAVVWSVPTLLWNTIPQWGIHAKDHTTSFHGTATILRESQIPYDVLVFGQDDLWPDAENLERLLGYDALVLPAVESVSDSQLTAIDDFLSGGGLLLTSGSPPDRNDAFEPLGESGDVFDHDNVIVFETDPGRGRLTDDESEGSIVAALKNHGIESVTTNQDDSVGVNHLTQPSASRHLFHLLNYDYDPDGDEFQRKRDIEIRLDGVPMEYGFARYFSPQGIEDLEITGGESRRVTVPHLVEWGFVGLAPSESQLEDSGSRETAITLISEANTWIQKARAESSRTTSHIHAESKRDAAETALEFGEVTLAISEARRAIEIAESLVPTETPSDPTERTSQVESPGQPGFGVLSALAAVGGGMYLVSRILRGQGGN